MIIRPLYDRIVARRVAAQDDTLRRLFATDRVKEKSTVADNVETPKRDA